MRFVVLVTLTSSSESLLSTGRHLRQEADDDGIEEDEDDDKRDAEVLGLGVFGSLAGRLRSTGIFSLSSIWMMEGGRVGAPEEGVVGALAGTTEEAAGDRGVVMFTEGVEGGGKACEVATDGTGPSSGGSSSLEGSPS